MSDTLKGMHLDRATLDLEAPFAVLDMAALRANADDLVRRARGKPIRIASKSLRCRAVLDEVLAMDGFHGVLAFTLPEALWLAGHGIRDIVVAYPTSDRGALAALAANSSAAAEITVMVDSVDHLDFVEEAIAPVPHREPIRICLDIDAGFVALAGAFRAGARRSPVRTPAQAVRLAREVVRRPGLTLAGVMAYEAQIAGVGDRPANLAIGGVIRMMQAASQRELAVRRGKIVAAVRDVAELEFVNGGGTGSVEKTVRERAVTEVAAGSGLYHPRLFDFYSGFRGRPAALFALPVVRRPGPGVATVLGGGYVASGPAGAVRLPQPYWPRGLRFDPQEGAGEVQTPLLGAAADRLRLGDRVWFRHAKAGEVCERFDVLHLVDGEQVVDAVPTYRGEGMAFL